MSSDGHPGSEPVPGPDATPTVLSRWQWTLLALGVAGLILAELRAMSALLYSWEHRPMYSYGYLVPLISGVLAWSQREKLRALPLRWAALPAVPWLLAWALLMCGGHFAGVVLLEEAALLPGLTAIVVLVWGHAALRALWPSIAYLALMIPVWDAFTEPLHGRFQLMSATIGVHLLQVLSIPVHQDGVYIYLPALTIEVARACSGVNYLVAVLALGLPLSYLQLRSPWRRVFVVTAAIAVAILSNGLRVALISLLAYLDVGSPLHGPAHMLHGLFVAGIGHITLFAGVWWLRKREESLQITSAVVVRAPRLRRPASSLATSVVAVGVFWAGAALVHGFAAVPRQLASGLQLPVTLGAWVAAPYAPGPLTYWPNADAQLATRYRRPERVVDVFVTYYAAQAQDRELVSYLAQELHARARARTVAGTNGPFAVNLTRQDRDGRSRLVCFWYELDGGPQADATRARLAMFWSAVRERSTSGAAVALVTDLDAGADENAAAEALVDVASRIRPLLVEQFSNSNPTATAALAPVPSLRQ